LKKGIVHTGIDASSSTHELDPTTHPHHPSNQGIEANHATAAAAIGHQHPLQPKDTDPPNLPEAHQAKEPTNHRTDPAAPN